MVPTKPTRCSQFSNRKRIIGKFADVRSYRRREGSSARNLGRNIDLRVRKRISLLGLHDTDVHDSSMSINHIDNKPLRILRDPDSARMIGLWFLLRLELGVGDVPHLQARITVAGYQARQF